MAVRGVNLTFCSSMRLSEPGEIVGPGRPSLFDRPSPGDGRPHPVVAFVRCTRRVDSRAGRCIRGFPHVARDSVKLQTRYGIVWVDQVLGVAFSRRSMVSILPSERMAVTGAMTPPPTALATTTRMPAL